jgi:hypothetical protein
MTLLAEFHFIDDAGTTWTAPVGARIDGTSIPKPFWSLIGGPYEGEYRNASIVHDAECIAPYKHSWQAVRRMFHAGCIAGGVDRLTALLLYAAVYLFGPHWELPSGRRQTVSRCTLDDALRTTAWLRQRPRATLADIDALTVPALRAQISPSDIEAERQLRLK